jgi:7-keto-8-aminopelargonate synthetase-like enzyme
MNIQTLNGRQVRINNQDYLYFGGTSYLAMHTNPSFRAWIVEGFAQFGSNYGGSRRSNLQFEVIARAEAKLAQWTQQAAALTYSSGTLAAQALIQFLSHTHQLLYTPDAHPALWQGGNMIPSSDHWEETIIQQVRDSSRDVAVICNGVDPLRVNRYDFSWWNNLPKDRSTVVVLDESHSLGIVGHQGAGNSSLWTVPNHVELVLTSSLAKAFGVPGGVVIGRKERIDALAMNALFGGASPIVPAYLYAFLQAEALYKTQLHQLRTNIVQLQQSEIARKYLKHLPNYPVFKVEREEIVKELEVRHILISSFPYPKQDDPCLNRIVLNAAHRAEDIKALVATFEVD